MNQCHPRYQHTLEDLFLTAFIYIDDWPGFYHECGVGLPSDSR